MRGNKRGPNKFQHLNQLKQSHKYLCASINTTDSSIQVDWLFSWHLNAEANTLRMSATCAELDILTEAFIWEALVDSTCSPSQMGGPPKIGVGPKSSILKGCSIKNHPFWWFSTPIFGSTKKYNWILHLLVKCIRKYTKNPTNITYPTSRGPKEKHTSTQKRFPGLGGYCDSFPGLGIYLATWKTAVAVDFHQLHP